MSARLQMLARVCVSECVCVCVHVCSTNKERTNARDQNDRSQRPMTHSTPHSNTQQTQCPQSPHRDSPPPMKGVCSFLVFTSCCCCFCVCCENARVTWNLHEFIWEFPCVRASQAEGSARLHHPQRGVSWLTLCVCIDPHAPFSLSLSLGVGVLDTIPFLALPPHKTWPTHTHTRRA